MRTALPFRLLARRFVGCLLATFAIGLGSGCSSSAVAESKPANDIVVSAANYAQTPPDVLAKMFRHRTDVVDPPPLPPVGDRPMRRYQFLASEPLTADLSFPDVCKLLVPELAKKNLFNTTDLTKADFVLRVTFGGRLWRDPFVRENDLAWRQGLVPKKRNTAFNAEEAFDERAGGSEAALRQLESVLVDSNPEAAGIADSLIDGMPTVDYYLIVVDAFDVATLKKKGNNAPRAWTIFIAVPQQKGVKFSDVAANMIAKAAPYFGETAPGKIHFTDREGTVKVGNPKVIDDKEDTSVPKK